MAQHGVLSFSFNGTTNGGGAVSIPGAKVGDVMFLLNMNGNDQPLTSIFEYIISVDDQIQQAAGQGDLSSTPCKILLYRGASF